MKNKYSLDNYEISNWLLKLMSPVIASTLTLLFNQMIQEETFPAALKISKVIPLHKAGDQKN